MQDDVEAQPATLLAQLMRGTVRGEWEVGKVEMKYNTVRHCLRFSDSCLP